MDSTVMGKMSNNVFCAVEIFSTHVWLMVKLNGNAKALESLTWIASDLARGARLVPSHVMFATRIRFMIIRSSISHSNYLEHLIARHVNLHAMCIDMKSVFVCLFMRLVLYALCFMFYFFFSLLCIKSAFDSFHKYLQTGLEHGVEHELSFFTRRLCM